MANTGKLLRMLVLSSCGPTTGQLSSFVFLSICFCFSFSVLLLSFTYSAPPAGLFLLSFRLFSHNFHASIYFKLASGETADCKICLFGCGFSDAQAISCGKGVSGLIIVSSRGKVEISLLDSHTSVPASRLKIIAREGGNNWGGGLSRGHRVDEVETAR
jgi:hypothetical protein